MKKYFNIIVVLISLSLLGIFYVQYSQLFQTYQNREDEIKERIISTISSVGDEISVKIFLENKEYNIESLDYLDVGTSENLIYKYYTKDILSVKDLKEKIRKKLNKNGLRKMHFEFAIVNNNRLVKKNFSSYGYYRLLRAKENYNVFSYPIYYTNYLNQDFSSSKYKKPDEKIYVIIPNLTGFILSQLKWYISASLVFSIIILVSFFLTLRLMFNQKKLSDLKNDFINNVTHELKTPISTVSLAAEAIQSSSPNGQGKNSGNSSIKHFISIIKEENSRLENLVDGILNSAKAENHTLKLDFETLSLHEIITNLLNKYRLKLKTKQSKVELKLRASHHHVLVDKEHFTNAISNIIDNAIKYSKEDIPLELSITSYNKNQKLFVEIKDNGIGMSKSTQKKIFEKFYRASTGNIHSTKGHGLGIFYAKSIFEGHKATIDLVSQLGKGSMFTISITYINP